MAPPSPDTSVNVLSIQIINCSRLSGAAMGLPGMPATLVAALLFALRAPALRMPCAVPLPPCGGHSADGRQPLLPDRPCTTSSGMLPPIVAAVPGELGQADVGLLALSCSLPVRPTLLREMGGNTTLGRSTVAADSAESRDAESTCVPAAAAPPSPASEDSCGSVPPRAGEAHRRGCCSVLGDVERPGEPAAAPVSLLASSAVDVSTGSGDAGPSSSLSSAAVPASSALYMCVLLSGWLACRANTATASSTSEAWHCLHLPEPAHDAACSRNNSGNSIVTVEHYASTKQCVILQAREIWLPHPHHVLYDGCQHVQ